MGIDIRLGKCDSCGKEISDGDSVVHYECWNKLIDEIRDLNSKVQDLENKLEDMKQ